MRDLNAVVRREAFGDERAVTGLGIALDAQQRARALFG